MNLNGFTFHKTNSTVEFDVYTVEFDVYTDVHGFIHPCNGSIDISFCVEEKSHRLLNFR